MHFVYIIHSPKFDKYYIDEINDIINRLEEHNTRFYRKSSTAFTDDWELKKQIKVQNRNESRKIEQYIKSMKSKKFIISLISNLEYYSNFKKVVFQKFNIEILD